jgi:hypothetical protein
MGSHRTFEHLQRSYFLWTTPEILDRIRDLEAAGIQDLVLATCADHLEQLERFASESSGHFASARAEMLWSIAFDDHLGVVVSDICLVDPNPEEGRASASEGRCPAPRRTLGRGPWGSTW